mmetsp:Transcript_116385/g.324300  ORF Transcript_116385/g.324300 Transcript_116385/m.324300 type:complete len:343 (+) Transcript_116385:808-1836(+)
MHHTKDFREAIMESIISRSSWKNVRTRITRTTRTIRRMRRTRITERLANMLLCTLASTIISTTPTNTMTTSKTFQATSAVRKKSNRPSAVQRSANSMTNTTQKMLWMAKKTAMFPVPPSAPRRKVSSMVCAIHWTCQPVANELARISITLIHSNALLVVMRCNRVCDVIASAFFCMIRYWSTDFFLPFRCGLPLHSRDLLDMGFGLSAKCTVDAPAHAALSLNSVEELQLFALASYGSHAEWTSFGVSTDRLPFVPQRGGSDCSRPPVVTVGSVPGRPTGGSWAASASEACRCAGDVTVAVPGSREAKTVACFCALASRRCSRARASSASMSCRDIQLFSCC